MSFYNADPRAYFQWYDKEWDEVWDEDDNKWTIDDLEVGRLVRIIDTDSQSSENNNYKIYKVTINNETKTLEKLDLTNPYSMAIGENTAASGNNSVALGKDTIASGNNSVAMGEGTTTTGTSDTPINNLTVIGQYNATPEEGDLFIVGNGDNENSKNSAFIISNRTENEEDHPCIQMNLPIETKDIHTQGDVNIIGDIITDGKITVQNGDIITQGNLQSDNGQLILTEKLSDITTIPHKKILNIRGSDIYINNTKYNPTSISGTLTIANTSESGILLATILVNDNPEGEIKLPSIIEQHTTIGNDSSNGNLTVQGTTIANNGLKTNQLSPLDGGTEITIPSGNTLKINNITSTIPTGDGAINLSLNATGNTIIGNTNTVNGTTSGLQYGNYPIKIVDTLPTGNENDPYTIYIVLNNT